MTESTRDKTKRNLIAHLKDYEWKYQYSIFPKLQGNDKDEDSEIANYALLDYDNKFRRKLGERFPNIAILFEFRRGTISSRFRTTYRKSFTQVYITFHTSEKLDENKWRELVSLIYGDVVNLKSRNVIDGRIENNVTSIQRQKLHARITRKSGIGVARYTVINSKFLIHRQTKEDDLIL